MKTYNSAHVSVQIKDDKPSVAKPLKLSGAKEYKIAVAGTYAGAKQDIKI